MLAISKDSPSDSRAFARSYGLPFSLLSDTDGAVSRIYAGVTSDDNTLPGITVIGADGRIVFRQVASAKDDRMSAAELIATIDRTLGTRGPAFASNGFAAVDRLQLRLDGGGGIVDAAGLRGSGVGMVSALLPLGRHVVVGARATVEPREAPLALDGVVMVRAPVFGNAAALELGVVGGWTAVGARGANAGAVAGLWFAMAPTWSLQLGVTFMVHDVGGSSVPEAFVTFGVARLIQVR